MSDQPSSETTKLASPQAVNAQFRLHPPDYGAVPAMYANFAQATLAQHDLTLFFGWYATPPLNEPPEGPVDVPVRPLVGVSVPLGIVRPLIRVLEAQADAWEQSSGQKLPAADPLLDADDRGKQ